MKKFIVVSFILFLCIFNILKVNAYEYASNAKGAILIEEETGEILYSKNEHDRLIPASMTKIMSLILVSEKIENNNINLNDNVTISAYAASMGGSQVYLKEGEVLTVEDLLKCVTIVSANDACVALAELTYGSEERFVSEMNQRVEDLGLENTLFQDTTGLTDVNHYSSAYDMSMMSKHLLNNYKDLILPFTSTYDDYIREDTESPFWLVTTNKLVKHIEGLDGLKTGV
ncbi:MAG: serine hydrolase [bacterium]